MNKMIAASSEQLFCDHPQSLFGTVPSQGVPHQHLWPDYGLFLCSVSLLLVMGRKKFNSQSWLFIFFLFHILLAFYFLNPLYFLMLPFKFTITTGSAGNVQNYMVKESQQKFCRSKACPASPCSKLTLAAPASGLTRCQLWKRHSVSIRYHLVVPTAPAQSAVE